MADHEDFFKFPRTHHLFAMVNSMSRDDLLHERPKNFYGVPVTVEEKIDGANIGISLDANTGRLVAQNRSHWVTSASATQFKQLDQWMDEHRDELVALLGNQYILFGEWMLAKHTVVRLASDAVDEPNDL
jgi:atypical dual specificity phosphatase